MVQEGEGGATGDGLIAPRRLLNPCLENPQRLDLHRELLFNQKMGTYQARAQCRLFQNLPWVRWIWFKRGRAVRPGTASCRALRARTYRGPQLVPLIPADNLSAMDMFHEGEGGTTGDGLISPRHLLNPCLESPQSMDQHHELLFDNKIGKNVLNQKSELQRALSKHKEKQIMNQVREHKETPELERAIAERARRLEQAEQSTEEPDPGTNPTLQEVRARLRHAAPPTSAH
ncbi:unnamed protein product [Chilo suppressalis]|uniref:Protein FAM107B n=1 Tax=Chilo suppressalis TaxID=168631 RepID=A0ABN8LD00_CHISP|nr:unnamed protein product [Chilo suppressalis]